MSPPFPENPLVWAGCSQDSIWGVWWWIPELTPLTAPWLFSQVTTAALLSSTHWAFYQATALCERRSHPMSGHARNVSCAVLIFLAEKAWKKVTQWWLLHHVIGIIRSWKKTALLCSCSYNSSTSRYVSCPAKRALGPGRSAHCNIIHVAIKHLAYSKSHTIFHFHQICILKYHWASTTVCTNKRNFFFYWKVFIFLTSLC